MAETPTPKTTAVILDTNAGEAFAYYVDAGPTLDTQRFGREEALARLRDVFGIATHLERSELLDEAERVCLLELGRLLELADFVVGEAVEVHAFGHWYAGTVVKLARTRITVTFVTGSGAVHDKAVDPGRHQTRFGSLVRKTTELGR